MVRQLGFNKELVDTFIKPESVSVSEVRGSAIKRRLMVEGNIIEVCILLL